MQLHHGCVFSAFREQPRVRASLGYTSVGEDRERVAPCHRLQTMRDKNARRIRCLLDARHDKIFRHRVER